MYNIYIDVNTITKKANCTLGFLHQNLRHCPTACKLNAYLLLNRQLLKYGAISWDLYVKQDVDKLEWIQRNAACFIARDYRSMTHGFATGLLHKHDLPTLHERRKQMYLIIMYDSMRQSKDWCQQCQQILSALDRSWPQPSANRLPPLLYTPVHCTNSGFMDATSSTC